jgi:hypothetical protein
MVPHPTAVIHHFVSWFTIRRTTFKLSLSHAASYTREKAKVAKLMDELRLFPTHDLVAALPSGSLAIDRAVARHALATALHQ